jgi:hypothetical protein
MTIVNMNNGNIKHKNCHLSDGDELYRYEEPDKRKGSHDH